MNKIIEKNYLLPAIIEVHANPSRRVGNASPRLRRRGGGAGGGSGGANRGCGGDAAVRGISGLGPGSRLLLPNHNHQSDRDSQSPEAEDAGQDGGGGEGNLLFFIKYKSVYF